MEGSQEKAQMSVNPGGGDEEDEDWLNYNVDKVCSQRSSTSPQDKAVSSEAGKSVGGEAAATGVVVISHEEGPAVEDGDDDKQVEEEEAKKEEKEEDDESIDDGDGYVPYAVTSLSLLKWCKWERVWRPCRLLVPGDWVTRSVTAPPLQAGHVHVELFPTEHDASSAEQEACQAQEEDLLPYNHEEDGGAERWSANLIAQGPKGRGASVGKKRKRKSMATSKKPTITHKDFQLAMSYAQQTLEMSLKAIADKKAAVAAAAEAEEVLSNPEETVVVDVATGGEGKEVEEEAEVPEEEEENAEASSSRLLLKGNVHLRPGDLVWYKREGVAQPEMSRVLAINRKNVKSKDEEERGEIIQLQDKTWLSAEQDIIKVKTAKSFGLEAVPKDMWRLMKVKLHILNPYPLKGVDVDGIKTAQQIHKESFDALNEEINNEFLQIFSNKKKGKGSKPGEGQQQKASASEESKEATSKDTVAPEEKEPAAQVQDAESISAAGPEHTNTAASVQEVASSTHTTRKRRAASTQGGGKVLSGSPRKRRSTSTAAASVKGPPSDGGATSKKNSSKNTQ